MQTVTLNEAEQEILFRQDPSTVNDGGYQHLLITLQTLLNQSTGEIELPAIILERTQKYAFDYGNGGWEERLNGIFSRTLGDNLGR